MDLMEQFYGWITSQTIDGATITGIDSEHIKIDSTDLTGEVNFYDINSTIVVEERVEDKKTQETTFFLHYELTDIEFAKQSFQDVADFVASNKNQIKHVLLCCTCGMTTTFFANKLNEKAELIGIKYDFKALPVTEAIEHGNSYAAVLLAPQVGYAEKDIREACPDALIIPVPPTMYGAYDVGAVLQLLIETVTNARHDAVENLRMARDIDNTKRVLAISWVHRNDEPTLSYRVLEKGEITSSGMFVKKHFNRKVLADLVSMLAVDGYSPDSFDAVGLAIPGEVEGGMVTKRRANGAVTHIDYGAILSQIFGNTLIRVDNNASAAAAGCYITQDVYDNLCFHAQEIGKVACDQGYIINGKPHVGHRGFAGSLHYVASNFRLSMPAEQAAWKIDGSLELVTRYLANTICLLSPDAIFVWADLVPGMDELREEIIKEGIPKDVMPELIGVSQYDDLTLIGELALCLQGLAADTK